MLENGAAATTKFNTAKVRKPLVAVSASANKGNMVLFDGEECTGDFITLRATEITLQYETAWWTEESANYGIGAWSNRIHSMRLPRQTTIQLWWHQMDVGLVPPGEFIGNTHTEYVCQDMKGYEGKN